MLQLGFKPFKADPCVWIREVKNKYEYITIYVDDLFIASEKPQQVIQDLKEIFKLKIKGDGPLEYHHGYDYKPDKDSTLAAQPTKYINEILESYKKMFPNENFLNVESPREKNDHPELDNTKLCNEEQIITGFYPNFKILLVLYLCEYLFKIYTTDQFTYFIDVFIHGEIKNPKINEIQQVHQTICTKQV